MLAAQNYLFENLSHVSQRACRKPEVKKQFTPTPSLLKTAAQSGFRFTQNYTADGGQVSFNKPQITQKKKAIAR